MRPISYKRHRFPPDVIRQAVWLYFHVTLSLGDVEEMLAERGIDVSYETIRCWTMKFGTAIATNIRKLAPEPTAKRMYMWRTVLDVEQAQRVPDVPHDHQPDHFRRGIGVTERIGRAEHLGRLQPHTRPATLL